MRSIIFRGETINGSRSIGAALDYVKDGAKTSNGHYIEYLRCSSQNTQASMELVQNLTHCRGDREYRHIVQSFAPWDKVEPEKVLELGKRTADFFSDYQCCVAYHGNTRCPHWHLIVNSVNLRTGKKLSMSPSNFRSFWKYSLDVYRSMSDLPQDVSTARMKQWMKFLQKSMKDADDGSEMLEMPEDLLYYPDFIPEDIEDIFQDWYMEDEYDFCDEENETEPQIVRPIIYLSTQEPKLICPITYINRDEDKFIRPIEYISTDTKL